MSRVFLAVHLGWATRSRRRILHAELDAPLATILDLAARRVGCTPLAIGAALDHVHVIVHLAPTTSVVRLAQRLKGVSSFELKKQCIATGLRWQVGYFAESVSPCDLDRVIRYVRNQRLHHDDSHPMESWLEDSDSPRSGL